MAEGLSGKPLDNHSVLWLNNYMSTAAPTVHLIGIGSHKAKPVGEVEVGNILVWNHGSVSQVVAIKQVSAKFVEFTLRSYVGSPTTVRRMKTDRLVAVRW